VLNLFGTVVLKSEKLPKKAAAVLQRPMKKMKVGDYEKSLIKSRLATASYSIKDDNLIAGTYNTIAANFDQLAECDKAYFII
jgi:hypothetical protein